jgi:hypothetical protein
VIAESHWREKNALARSQIFDILAQLNDLAGNITSWNVRQRRFRSAFAYPEIQVIHGAGLHAYQYLVLAQHGIGDLFVPQNLGTAILVKANGVHDVRSSQNS